MTPAARVQTAIEILDQISAGEPAEKALTRWARSARHAGSKDRAAVRDHVFDALRCWWSSAARGGGESGRARMIGLLRSQGHDLAELFSGQGYGPTPLAPEELTASDDLSAYTELDCPEWLGPALQAALGDDFAPVLRALQTRAPVFLRVNARNTDREGAIAALAREDIATEPHPLSETALKVLSNPRRVQSSQAWVHGMIELQDAASQAVVDMLPLDDAKHILDFCAGGGGKALAMAALTDARIDAHDIDPARMKDLPARAERAGVTINIRRPDGLGEKDLYDLVLVDAPCSGSGAWRRSPEGKIRLTPEALERLTEIQETVLEQALRHVRPGGTLAYATCSLLHAENDAQVDRIAQRKDISVRNTRHFTPMDGGDGFYCAVLTYNP